MKITVLYDSDGVIIAGAPRTGDYDDPVPVASDDNRAGTFDVVGSGASSGRNLHLVPSGSSLAAARRGTAQVGRPFHSERLELGQAAC
jgi:hypothetical protein